jgi:hypothetical protein
VPKVSEFFGIAIYLYYREHLPPHFHAIYAGDEVEIGIENLAVIAGRLTPRAMGLVLEWAVLHQDDLRTAWAKVTSHQPPGRIEPLR